VLKAERWVSVKGQELGSAKPPFTAEKVIASLPRVITLYSFSNFSDFGWFKLK
jgi:hypothetical protein